MNKVAAQTAGRAVRATQLQGKPMAKPATKPRPSAAKPKPVKPAAPSTADLTAPEAAPAPGVYRLKDLVEEVAAATGAKPKDARVQVMATLTALGAALGQGKGLNLPEVGKGRISRSVTDANGVTAMVLKLRRGEAAKKKDGSETLAEPED